MRGEIVATIWHDEAIGLAIASVFIMIIGQIFSDRMLQGYGLGLITLTVILVAVEVIRNRPDADKFKAITYINKLRGK